jgi:adenine-specific DNA-methyltransferase
MAFNQITANDPESKSLDFLEHNMDKLKELFPELVTEGPDGVSVNIDVLKQLVGDKTVTDSEEKYGLNWHGKRAARRLALTPSTGTLRPCPEDSLDWDTTQNLMIEGDNLEVLKLLQKSYASRVDLIYIDPPYNTGNDFIYPDNYQDNKKYYQCLSGLRDESGNIVSSVVNKNNSASSGRFHTSWLNMMYPRLKLARSLLHEYGLIMISIDDNEAPNLRIICDDIFGEENFLGTLTWIRRTKPINSGDAKYQLQQKVEYVSVYCRNRNRPNTYAFNLPITEERKYNHDGKFGKCRLKDIEDSDIGGKARDTMKFPILGITPEEGKRWKIGIEEANKLIEIDRVRVINGKIKIEVYPNDEDNFIYKPFWSHFDNDEVKTAEDGKAEFNELMGAKLGFDTVKPVSLIQTVLNYLPNDLLIMDFFAGTGTTAHAILNKNFLENKNSQYILVQLPEPLDITNKDQKSSAEYCDLLGKPRNITELTKERLRRASKKIKDENPLIHGDLGFRVFKLDSSNIHAWEADRDNLPKTLEESIEHLKPDRTESDILYELLLKLGLDLCVPIENKSIAGKTVYSIGNGVLLVCMAEQISQSDVEPLTQGIIAWHKQLAPVGDTTCVFRDSAFSDDVTKTNLSAILNQYGLTNIRSL